MCNKRYRKFTLRKDFINFYNCVGFRIYKFFYHQPYRYINNAKIK